MYQSCKYTCQNPNLLCYQIPPISFLPTDDSSVNLIWPLISVDETQCIDGCTCHYSPWKQANIFTCINGSMTSLPTMMPNDTNWLIFKGNNIGSLTTVQSHLNEIIHFEMSFNNITSISNSAMSILLNNTQCLNIEHNALKTLPRSVKNYHAELWISHNPYECKCSMLWLRDWLVQSTNVMNGHSIKCKTGKKIGTSFRH